MRALLAAPLVAVSFLSVLPVPLPSAVPGAAFPRSVAFFPLVGAGLGAVVAGADALLRLLLPVQVASALDLALLAVLTGGLHLDGLADAADGLLAPLDRARRLEVMREGSVGAFGVAAVALVLLVDFAALASVPPADRAAAIVAAVAASRAAVSVAVVAFPYARREGVGTAFRDGLGPLDGAVALVVAAAVATALLGIRGATLLATAVAAALALGSLARARLGGLTGDVYGAAAETTFAMTLVVQVGTVRA